MSPWRDVWADFVHEWRTETRSTRILLLAGLPVALLRIAASVMMPGHGLWVGMATDVRHGWRRLVRTPVYFVFAVATLAVVLAVTPTVHAVLSYFLWQPSTLEQPEQVLQVRGGSLQQPDTLSLSWPDWLDYAQEQRAFESVAGVRRHVVAVQTDAGVSQARGEVVTTDFFNVMRTPMAAGRPLLASDFEPGATPAVVLAERAARRYFGSASAAVDRLLTLGGDAFMVVGVTPPGFIGGGTPFAPPEYWLPLENVRHHTTTMMPAAFFDPSRRSLTWLQVHGRLAPGHAELQASDEARRIGAALEERFPSAQPERNARRWSAGPVVLRELEIFGPMAVAALAALGLVVMLACTNLANLGLSRSTWRQHDLSMRRALGGSRWRLVREQLMESAIVIALASTVAVIATRWALTSLTMEVPIGRGLFVWMEPEITPAVALVGGAFALVCLLVAGLWPAIRASAASRLMAAGGTGRSRMRLQRALIVLQVTGSVTLLMTTVSIVDATTRSRPDPGVDLDRLGVATVDLLLTPRDAGQQLAFRDGVLAALTQAPGIEAAAVSDSLPFGQMSNQLSLFASDDVLQANKGLNTYDIRATEGFFAALGIPIIAGRALNADDIRTDRAVVVLSRKNAIDLYGTEQAVGRRVWYVERVGSATRTGAWDVVGVAADTDTFTMGSRRTGLIVRPLSLPQTLPLTVSARGTHADTAVAAVRQAIRQTDRTIMMSGAATGWTALAGPYFVGYAIGWVAAVMGGLTLILVMSGLYGVLATSVAQARREMAIRLALGSTREQLVRRVIASGARPAALGLVIGLAFGIVFRFAIRGLLPRVDMQAIVDPLGLIVIPIVIALATLAATALPARRASAIDPNIVLRQE